MPTRRARPHAALSPAEQLADRWHSLAIHLLRTLKREDERGGLTGPRASALSVLVFGGSRTVGQLAAAEQVRPPTMTRLVRALERDGLVRRERRAADARVVHLHATARGKELLLAARARRVRRLAEPLAQLSAPERDALARSADALARVVRALA